MKMNLPVVCAFLATALTLAAPLASAQSAEGIRVKFDQPVAAASQTLPAGSYNIRVMPSQSEVPVLAIESDGGTEMFALAERLDRIPNDRTSVTLERHNGGLAIDTVHLPDGDYRLLAASHSAR